MDAYIHSKGELEETVQAANLIVALFAATSGACTTVLQDLDEHDAKARYRRGKAYLLLGMTKSAKDDFMFILKSPYSTNEGVHAARLGLQELRRVLNTSAEDARKTLSRSISGCLFSRDRHREAQGPRLAPAEETEESENDSRLHTPLHAEAENADFRLPPSKASEHLFSNKQTNKYRHNSESYPIDEPISDQAITPDNETVHTPQHSTQHMHRSCTFLGQMLRSLVL